MNSTLPCTGSTAYWTAPGNLCSIRRMPENASDIRLPTKVIMIRSKCPDAWRPREKGSLTMNPSAPAGGALPTAPIWAFMGCLFLRGSRKKARRGSLAAFRRNRDGSRCVSERRKTGSSQVRDHPVRSGCDGEDQTRPQFPGGESAEHPPIRKSPGKPQRARFDLPRDHVVSRDHEGPQPRLGFRLVHG